MADQNWVQGAGFGTAWWSKTSGRPESLLAAHFCTREENLQNGIKIGAGVEGTCINIYIIQLLGA